MNPIYLDLHIHTSQDANHLNAAYDMAELVRKIKEFNGDSDFLISLTDHNTINKLAYKKGIALGVNMILGVELHIKLHEDVKSYHCHIYFNVDITDESMDRINIILDKLYPNKLPSRDAATIPDIQEIINSFDGYDFMLLPHGSQRHGAFNYSLHEGERIDNAIYRSIYYNQFDGFTARSNKGLEKTRSYFKQLGISEFINLLTCSDNYSPTKYPEPHSETDEEFIPTWMFAEPTFSGVRLSLSESSRLLYQKERPEIKAEHIKRVKLQNEFIDIDVQLTEGLNVVIGGSSSGKTLFVDSLYRSIDGNFEGTQYHKYGVENLYVNNPASMKPYYISQNFIAENLANNEEKSIDKITILKNIFPGDEEINRQITDAINHLNTDINDMLAAVKTIEECSTSLGALPHPGKLILSGDVQKNIFLPLVPTTAESEITSYTEKQLRDDTDKLNQIKCFLEKNPFTLSVENEIGNIIKQLQKAQKASSLFENIKDEIVCCKKIYDDILQGIQGINQEHVENRERLFDLIEKYVTALKHFNDLRESIIKTNYRFQTREIVSMGHKLSIENTFHFDKDFFMSCLEKYLKSSFKRISDVCPENLFSSKFKQRPLVKTYQELANKIQSDLMEANSKKYFITSREGKDFQSLSPGWKTAIILDLILGYKDDNAPIIIDQPEDNLAVKYINTDLVQTIKKTKTRKQIILVSHNATIPMMADAQNIIWCRNVDNKIKIRSAYLEGSIEDKNVLEIIADQTDGGKASIKKRVKKYNFKNYN